MPLPIAAACAGFIAPPGNSAITDTALAPALTLPAATPPTLMKSSSFSLPAAPVPTTSRQSDFRLEGARISSTERLLPLNFAAEAARLTISAAEPSDFAVRGPNLRVSSVNTTTVPRGAVENGTNPTLTASAIAYSFENLEGAII